MFKKILLQVFFWATILIINLAFMAGRDPRTGFFEFACVVIYAIVFYFNILLLFPKFYENKRFQYFILGFVMIFTAMMIIRTLDDVLFPDWKDRHHRRNDWLEVILAFRQALWLVLIFLIGTVYSIQGMLNRQIKRHEKVMEEKLQTELQLLKAQINPHFLFNALNNIYSLTYLKSPKAPESVLKLSEMLRYVIEECNDEKVALHKEIAYIENFIEFNRMKIPGKTNIEFKHDIQNEDIQIAPVLFVPFIENSFKYSRLEEDKDGFIYMELRESAGNIYFHIKNSIFTERTILPGSGKGISNVKQRLEIIYQLKHKLTLQEKPKEYAVELEIELS